MKQLRLRLGPKESLLVYVGAPWCEPCKRFHAAAEQGILQGEFPDLVLVDFDWDADKDRLIAAGYDTHLVPLFVMPDDQGHGTDRRISGSVKGDGALANLVPRLHALLSGQPVQ